MQWDIENVPDAAIQHKTYGFPRFPPLFTFNENVRMFVSSAFHEHWRLHISKIVLSQTNKSCSPTQSMFLKHNTSAKSDIFEEKTKPCKFHSGFVTNELSLKKKGKFQISKKITRIFTSLFFRGDNRPLTYINSSFAGISFD